MHEGGPAEQSGDVFESDMTTWCNWHTYTNIYMVIDLKVLVRCFNCESRACYVGNPRDSFFSSSRMLHFFRKSFGKVGYHDCLT
jgi:hypothetical protein